MRKIALAKDDDEHDNIRLVNLLAEEGYNLLKSAVKVGALQ